MKGKLQARYRFYCVQWVMHQQVESVHCDSLYISREVCVSSRKSKVYEGGVCENVYFFNVVLTHDNW